MTTVPLGRGAYTRLYTGAPEIELINRWVESNPANLKEGVALISRPGTTPYTELSPGGFSELGSMRGNYTLDGLFNDSLFVVCGDSFYKINIAEVTIPITGVINGTGHPEVTWQAGVDYQRLWIADGLLLQFYSGGTHATGTVTKVGAITNGVDTFELGGVYYTWGVVFAGSDDGSLANPFVVDPLTDPMGQLNKAINASGIPGTDYSSTLGGANVLARSETDGVVPAVFLTLTSVSNNASSNLVTLSEAGTALTVSGATLTGGNIHALQGCTIPDGQTPNSVTQVDSYVLVSIAGSNKFYWIEPGEITINPLNFASKESSPDPIVQMRTVGDQVLIMGAKSTENWYATGNPLAPFAPIQGRAYQRGALGGSAVVLDDYVLLAGDDGKAYKIGLQGVTAISNNGIEERIRRQVRNELGLTP
jgi:hypothetical protein